MRAILTTFCTIFLAMTNLHANVEELFFPLEGKRLDSVIAKDVVNPDLNNIFERWMKQALEQLYSQSEVIDTASGPIEFKKKGSGRPVILCLHGGFGGYDQALLLGDHLVKQDFTVLAPSRPGYLRTPLFVGQTPEQQADAMVSLLDALKIHRVGIIGFSAGCPVAFQMALRYPDRVWGLVLESLGAQPTQGPIYEILVQLMKLEPLTDFGSWLLYLGTHSDLRGTAEFVLSLDTSLTGAPLRERTKFVLHHSHQIKLFKRLIHSCVPLSPRKDGLLNDINNLDPWNTQAYIGFYPLIKTPTMIIESIDDSNGNYQEAIFVSQRIPKAQLVSVGNTGHFIWLGEKTKQWETLLSRFLNNHRP